MKKLLSTLMLLCSSYQLILIASATPVSSTSPYQASEQDMLTISGSNPPLEQNQVNTIRRRSEERAYRNSDITGPTGINALAAKTRSILS